MPSASILFLAYFLTGGLAPLACGQFSNAQIRGEVLEASTEEAMEFVNVSLYGQGTDSLLLGSVTNAEGEFEFSHVPPGAYYVETSFIGFENKKTDAFQVEHSGSKLDLGEILIAISSILLEDVEVTAERSTYQLDLDRKVYNVEKDILSSASSASEILQNIPSVSVGLNGVVSLRGSSNITYLINGRPSAMMRHNSSNALQQIPASSIERIEVITNPSAKYKPDGTGGIINIVLKAARDGGYNGTLTGNVGNANKFEGLGRYNGSLLLNYGKNDFNAFINYGYRHDETPRVDEDEVMNLDGKGSLLSTFDETIRTDFNKDSHLASAGIEYGFGNNAVELSGTYFMGKDKKGSETSAVFTDKLNSEQDESFHTNGNFKEEEQEYELGIAFEHELGNEHTLVLEYAYSDFLEKEDGIYNQHFSLPAPSRDTVINNFIQISGPSHEVVGQYVKPLDDDTKVELGYLGEFMEEEIEFMGRSKASQEAEWAVDPLRTSRFIFTQNIHAGYMTLEHSLFEYHFLAGLRMEQAYVSSQLIDSVAIPNDYFNIFPTIHMGRELGDNQEIQLSYSKRINRADSDEQNPFPEYADPNNRDVGNPKLKPEKIHSLELSYRLQMDHFTFLPSIYYRFKEDGFTEVVRTVDENITETTFTNLTNEQSAGVEFAIVGNFADFLNVDLSANGFYQQIDAHNLGFSKYKSSFSYDAKLGAGIKITKSTQGQLNAYYRSSRITPQGEFNPIFLLNAGIRQEIIKHQASLLLTVSDVFNTLDYESAIDSPILKQQTKYGRNSQIVYLGFIYNFGQKVQKKRQKIQFDDKIEAGKKAAEEEE